MRHGVVISHTQDHDRDESKWTRVARLDDGSEVPFTPRDLHRDGTWELNTRVGCEVVINERGGVSAVSRGRKV